MRMLQSYIATAAVAVVSGGGGGDAAAVFLLLISNHLREGKKSSLHLHSIWRLYTLGRLIHIISYILPFFFGFNALAMQPMRWDYASCSQIDKSFSRFSHNFLILMYGI